MGVTALEVLRYVPRNVLRVGMLHDDHADVYNVIERYIGEMDGAVAVSQQIQQECQRRFPSLPCSYLQHGILKSNLSRQPNLNMSDALRLIYFGRLEEKQKRVSLLPAIYEALQRKGISVRLTIIGSGSAEGQLKERLAEGLRSGQVIFRATVPRREIARYVAENDVFLLTSRHEAGPLTLLEAMEVGLVPICGDIPSLVQELIDERNGFRVPFDEPSGYVNAIEQLYHDRPRLERLSQATKGTIDQRFSATAMAQRYVEFIAAYDGQTTPVWPDHISPTPIRGENSLKYSCIGRWARRLVKSFAPQS
jgi:glycosyltransferase involved in cell wall biosynthesis